MKLQDLSLEQLKEIVDGAPEGATHCFFDSSADDEKGIWYYKDNGNQSFDSGRWSFAYDPQFPRKLDDRLIKLSDIRARINEFEPAFKVGDRVVPQSDAVNLIGAVREVIEVDGDQIKYHMEAQVRSYWSKAKGWRHATPEEIATGHRIDSVSDEMASPCAVSDSAKNQAQMDLRGNKTDSITERLNPAKCGKVNPALAYDELGFDDMTIAHRSPACKCDADVSQPAPMVDGELHAPIGQKHDQGKPRYSLIPSGALASIVDVLEYGATKYAPDNWKHVENARERYYNASMRHVQSWWTGEQNDPETGLPHLAHAVCSLMFLMALKGEQVE